LLQLFLRGSQLKTKRFNGESGKISDRVGSCTPYSGDALVQAD